MTIQTSARSRYGRLCPDGNGLFHHVSIYLTRRILFVEVSFIRLGTHRRDLGSHPITRCILDPLSPSSATCYNAASSDSTPSTIDQGILLGPGPVVNVVQGRTTNRCSLITNAAVYTNEQANRGIHCLVAAAMVSVFAPTSRVQSITTGAVTITHMGCSMVGSTAAGS